MAWQHRSILDITRTYDSLALLCIVFWRGSLARNGGKQLSAAIIVT